MASEMEEFAAEKLKKKQAIEKQKLEMTRLIDGSRSAQILVVMPDGNVGRILFWAGYSDLKAMSVEAEEIYAEALFKIKNGRTETTM